MNSEKFTAETLSEAIESIRKKWGPEAVILHVERHSEPKRLFGSARQKVEVTARPPEANANQKASAAEMPLPLLEELSVLRKELQQYQNTVRQLERIQWARSQVDGKALQHPLLNFMLEKGLSPDYAMELLVEWTSGHEKLDITRCILELDGRLPKLSCENIFPVESGKCTIFLGLPGCGKTLLLTKIAAQLCLARKAEVILVSGDVSRPGAAQELIVYSEILQIPVVQIFDLTELKGVVEKATPGTQILVDWKGISPLDPQSWAAMRSLPYEDLKLQCILTLSLASDSTVWKGFKDKLAPLPIMGLALTQADLDWRLGKVWEAVRNTNLPISFFSLGKNIPGEFYDGKSFPFAKNFFGNNLPTQV